MYLPGGRLRVMVCDEMRDRDRDRDREPILLPDNIGLHDDEYIEKVSNASTGNRMPGPQCACPL